MSKTPRLIALIGNYGAGNLGDNLIAQSIMQLHSDKDFFVFAANPNDFQIQSPNLKNILPLFPIGIRSCLKGTFFSSYKHLKECDAVILGGGGLFQDERLLACIIWGWQFFWCRFLGKKVYLYATSVGPLHTKIGKWITKYVYNRAETLSVRDKISKEILQNIGVAQPIHITTDPVFLLQSHKRNPSNKVFLNFRPLQSNIIQKKDIRELVEYLRNTYGFQVECIVMQSNTKEDDVQFLQSLDLSIPIHIPQSHQELCSILKKAELVISMRLHLSIVSIMHSIPTLAINYSPKVEGIMKDLNLEAFLIEQKNVNVKTIKPILQKALQKEVFVKIEKDKIIQKAQKNKELFEDFLENRKKGA